MAYTKKSSDEIKQEIRKASEELEQGVLDAFRSGNFRKYLDMQAKFPHYSYSNCLLIARQYENATRVAGFGFWKSQGRSVNKGEKAIKILAPIMKTITVKKESEDGKEPEIEERKVVTSYSLASVFDISQTSGEPLPEICRELKGRVDNFNKVVDALEIVSPVPIVFGPVPGNAKGCYMGDRNLIMVKYGMGEVQTAKTIVHEMAHGILHNPQRILSLPEAERPDSTERELQAEAVAYIVCKEIGIDTSDYSFDYLASWSEGKDTKLLKKQMSTIQKTAQEIYEKLEVLLTEKTQEKEVETKAWISDKESQTTWKPKESIDKQNNIAR